jgi:Phage tail assembly chaperone protein
MTYYYSTSTSGFYHDSVHGAAIPGDSIELSDAVYYHLYEGICSGKIIQLEDSRLVLADPVVVITWEQIRLTRDSLLTSSDWTDTLSAKQRLGDEKYTQWQAYRQSLRDVPQTYSDPASVIWPNIPGN